MLFAPITWMIENNPEISNEELQEIIGYSLDSIIKKR